MSAEEAMRQLASTPVGLPASERQRRLERCGPNVLAVARSTSALALLLEQLKSIVVVLLLMAGAVALISGDLLDAVAIGVVLVLNTALGFATEYRAQQAIQALLALEVPHAVVLRDGTREEIRARDLVPGDVIELDAGRRLPADARLIAAADLTTVEAPLTGESLPVEKSADAVLAPDTSLADRVNMVYAATIVASGHGHALVTATGMRSEVGRIGALASSVRRRRTPLEARLDALGRRLVAAALAVAGLVALLAAVRGTSLEDALELGLALAVAAVPEGLPAVATIAMAVGVRRMARRSALVRHLPAVESLGSATVVCTDKTGTLTTGQPTVVELWLDQRTLRITGAGYDPRGSLLDDGRPVQVHTDAVLATALRIAALANRAEVVHDGPAHRAVGDPTEAALVVLAQKAGVQRARLLEESPEVGEVPFSAERRYMATLHRTPDGTAAYVKGAPRRIVEASAAMLTRLGPRPLSPADRVQLLERNQEIAARGLRVLALAVGEPGNVDEARLHALTFVAFVGMADPPAPGVRESLAAFQRAGIRTVMITGDQQLTAQAVARDLGLLRPGDLVLDGRELDALPDPALEERLAHVAAFSRVSPDGKLRIVRAYERRGEVVAMLGDGVNDAAALRQADVGVCMGGRGTDVAREAADVVLQDDRFQTIAAAVEEGRVIFDNIRKFVFYLFSCNLAEILVMLGAAMSQLPAPLSPLQILWLNLLTDTFPALALALEPAEDDVMRRPPQDPRTAILPPRLAWQTIGFAVLIAGVTLSAFLWALRTGPVERAITVSFMTLALAQIFHLGNARSRRPVLAPQLAVSNRYALAAVALAVGLQLLATAIPTLARALHLHPLDRSAWLVIVAAAAIPALVGQALKLRHDGAGAAADRV
ncbi:MAG TPA: cation-translocating P-type ATPase [Gemmatimonadales bacterium]|nr:cation-translocating P-type ATPase [Gemmatimonadales bacterium]